MSTQDKSKGDKIMMTKKEMVDYIEKTGLVINFDRNYLMRKLKPDLERLYMHCKRVKEN